MMSFSNFFYWIKQKKKKKEESCFIKASLHAYMYHQKYQYGFVFS